MPVTKISNLKTNTIKTTFWGKFTIFLSLILFITAYAFKNLLPCIAGIALLIYIIYIRLVLRYTIKELSFTITRDFLEKVKYTDKAFTVVLNVNDVSLGANVIIEDKIPQGCIPVIENENILKTILVPKKTYKLKYQVIPEEKGYYKFEQFRLAIKDKLDLFTYHIDLDLESETHVNADISKVEKSKRLLNKESIDIFTRSKIETAMVHEYEILGIREFIPGDNLKDIDWKSTSRFRILMTKIFEKESSITTIILLDCSRSMRSFKGRFSKMEHGIKLILEIGRMFQMHEHPLGLITYDESTILTNIPPVKGKSQYYKITNSLSNTPKMLFGAQYVPNYYQDQAPPEKKPADPATENYVSTIGTFLLKKKRNYKSSSQVTGIYEAVRNIVSSSESTKLILIISDMETNLEPLYEAIKLAKKHRHKALIITPFSPWYSESGPSVLQPKDLENIYLDYAQKQKAKRKLLKLGVPVVDTGPDDMGYKLIKSIYGKGYG